MEKFDYKGKIQVCGVTFDGVNDIIQHALKGISKEGVYVGEESQRYPCFDSEDYASENRYYWNFVFAKSEYELKDKMQKLKAMPVIGSNFKKLNNELHPMGYWGGDTNYPIEMTTEEMLVDAATMAPGSMISRAEFDELADNCEEEEMR